MILPTIPIRPSKVKRLDRVIHKIDKALESLHEDFDVHDREVAPAVHDLNRARMSLENLKISEERKAIE